MIPQHITRNKKTGSFAFSIEDYILYILNHLEPEKSDKIRLNKIAFFVEFAYIYFRGHPLSEAEYAAIDKGTIIDGYDSILKQMQKDEKIKVDGFTLRPLKSPRTSVPIQIDEFIEPLIKKYASLTNAELVSLSHLTDSYKITSKNERIMGKIIDKKLAFLESFFEENKAQKQLEESELPVIDKSKLVEYGAR